MQVVTHERSSAVCEVALKMPADEDALSLIEIETLPWTEYSKHYCGQGKKKLLSRTAIGPFLVLHLSSTPFDGQFLNSLVEADVRRKVWWLLSFCLLLVFVAKAETCP